MTKHRTLRYEDSQGSFESDKPFEPPPSSDWSKYNGLYFAGARGGFGFVQLIDGVAKVCPVFFDKRSTFERWREGEHSIPFKVMFEVIMDGDQKEEV